MKSIRRALTTVAVAALTTAGLASGGLAQEAGVVRITDQRAESPTVARGQSPPSSRTGFVVFDRQEGTRDRAAVHRSEFADSRGNVSRCNHVVSGPVYGPEHYSGGHEVYGGEVYGGDVYGGDLYGGQIVGGDYGGDWVGGECSSCCDGNVRITGNALLDAPASLLGCCVLNPIRSKLHCCFARFGGGGHWDGGGHGFGGGAGRSGRDVRIYPVDPNHFDPRDGQVYSAEGYGIPMAVPLAPTVHHTYNYGWGVPSSRITPISRPAGQ